MNKYDLIEILATVVTIVLCFAFTKWLFSTVMASNLPDWAKYLLLR